MTQYKTNFYNAAADAKMGGGDMANTSTIAAAWDSRTHAEAEKFAEITDVKLE